MSGTSMDGVDVAVIETDGVSVSAFGPTLALPYSDEDRAVLRQALHDASSMIDCGRRPGSLNRAEIIVTERHAEAIEVLCARAGMAPASADIIGFHGQTVLHRPEAGLTVQIGNPQLLAFRLGVPVVYNFRAADVNAGGQGAPLVPIFHKALAAMSGRELPLAFLNLGGVANITYIGRDSELTAFDTGPANALLDDWALMHTGKPFDADGALAGSGQVDRGRLEFLMDDVYFAQPAPKSLDRDHFAAKARETLSGLAVQEGAATLAAFTIESVAASLQHLPETPKSWIVCGGGVRNPVIMSGLQDRLGVPVFSADDCGFSSAFMEAQAFGYLAVRRLHDLPISFPATTGALTPMTGGEIVQP